MNQTEPIKMNKKHLGIWMDHVAAHLMELTTGDMVTTTIQSAFTSEAKKEILHKGEKAMHHKEQQATASYYKAIGDAIQLYGDVLLFGPTHAKTELFNLLRANHLFNHISIETKQADQMTEPQRQAFVRTYFFKHLQPIV